jgi:hypothetical protein
MSVLSYTCPTVGCYQNYPCDTEFQNKIVAVAFVKKSSPIPAQDKLNPLSWQTSLLQKYMDGDAYLIFNTSGDKPKPDTATTSGRGMLTTKTLAKTHTLNFMDMQGVTLANVQWYCDMLSSSQNYDFYYFTPDRIWDASGEYVTVIGDPVITGELNTYQQAEVVVTWTSKCNPLPYEFDTDSYLTTIYYSIAPVAPMTTSWTITTAGGSLSSWTSWDINLIYGIDDDSVVDSDHVFSVSGNANVLNSLGVSVDPETGEPTFTNPVEGSYTFAVVVQNESGCIFGSIDVTVEVVED